MDSLATCLASWSFPQAILIGKGATFWSGDVIALIQHPSLFETSAKHLLGRKCLPSLILMRFPSVSYVRNAGKEKIKDTNRKLKPIACHIL